MFALCEETGDVPWLALFLSGILFIFAIVLAVLETSSIAAIIALVILALVLFYISRYVVLHPY